MRYAHRSVLAFCLLVLTASASSAADLERRWLYLQLNLQVKENVEKFNGLARRAAAAGYNGIVLADYKLNILDRVPEHYFDHAKSVKATCAELNLELIPTVCSVGYSDGLLAHNPNLAEGLPVKGATFVVKDGVAVLESELKHALPGGGFEEHKNHNVPGWSFQDGPGKSSFVDEQVKHAGKSSLRFENLGGANGRVSRVLKVQPWRQYHASVWIKTAGYKASETKMFAMGADGRPLSHSNLGVKPDQDWTQHHVIFNSLDNTEVRFYCGAWGGKAGKLWLDDAQVEETALVNMVRRAACPLVVQADGKPLAEGTDFAELRDPKLGMVPYAGQFDVWHEPPKLTIPAGSKLANGAKLEVSFYHTALVYDHQVTCCLGDPGVFDVIGKQVALVEQHFTPKTYFLSHDEIRVGNWCPGCRREGQTAGQLLAENMRKCVAVIHKINPKARLCVWSDMFDPAHNAVKNFYLTDGDLAGAWEGLPKEMTIVNWNHEKAAKSLPFFAERGHAQVLAGYYDADPKSIAGWLDQGQGLSGVTGAMYTTWTGNFDHLETFAESAWGKKK